MKQLLILLAGLLAGPASTLLAQPIPPTSAGEKAHYIFTVYTPQNHQEATIWRTPEVELTTHRLINHADSTAVRLLPVRQTTLRTYVDLGAAAGAMEVVNAPGSPTLQEVLTYDQLLAPPQRQLIESYLAIRHGITLDQTVPTNYLAQDSNGNTYPVWTATAAPDFRHRIFGLAQDTAANLTRSKGSSVSAPELLTLQWDLPATTPAYLLLADNDAPTARLARADSLASLQLLERRWRLEATGTVTTARLIIAPRLLFARPRTGERWVLQLTQSNGNTYLPAEVLPDGRIAFDLPALPTGSAYLQLGLSCRECQVAPALPIDDFFTSVQLSPNPAPAGSPLQLRAALRQAAGLIIVAYDAQGREVVRQSLPSTTHHLTELVLPAPGAYSLHLRSRLQQRRSPHHSLKVLVH